MRRLKAQYSGIRHFVVLGIPPNLFAQERSVPFNIEYIVCNLKCPPNGMSVAFQSLYLSWRTAPEHCPYDHGSFDQRRGLMAMNVFQHLQGNFLPLREDVHDLPADHAKTP